MLLCIILFSIRTVIKFLKDRNRTSVLDDKASNEDYVVLGSLLHLGGWIYAVTAFEQNLHFNNLSPDEFEWSFGQILALVLLIGPLFDLCTALHDEQEPKAEMQPRAVGDQNLEAESEQGQNADQSQNDKKLLKRSSVLPPSGDLTSSQVLFVTAAGVVAAATGAHLMGHEITASVVHNGAIAGAIEAPLAMLVEASPEITSWQGLTAQALSLLLIQIFAGFALCALMAIIISQRTLGQGKKPVVTRLMRIVEPAVLIASLAGLGALLTVWAFGKLREIRLLLISLVYVSVFWSLAPCKNTNFSVDWKVLSGTRYRSLHFDWIYSGLCCRN
jgi:hypothetical protein